MSENVNNNKKIAFWLFSLCALIIIMIMVGGATRLTGSGLSMVRWEPISGIIPPLTEAEWQEEFSHYKAYPQYILENHYMNLADFKKIFMWEYSHRILGRIIGFWLLLPLLFFWIRGKIEKKLLPKLLFMFLLGGIQGLIGWWMVKSGLSDNPDVSQYRLAVHLGFAVIIYIYIFKVALSLFDDNKTEPKNIKPNDAISSINSVKIMIGLIYFQIILGAFVAGLNAGLIYNNWPMMGDSFIADGIFELSPFYLNFFENVATVQFDHRLMAYIILIFGAYLFIKNNKILSGDKKLVLINRVAFLSIIGQIAIGILTLVYVVPISLAIIHQGFAIAVLSLYLFLFHRLNKYK